MKINVLDEADKWVVVEADFVKADAGWWAEHKDDAGDYRVPIMGFAIYESPNDEGSFTRCEVDFNFREMFFDRMITPDGTVLEYNHTKYGGVFMHLTDSDARKNRQEENNLCQILEKNPQGMTRTEISRFVFGGNKASSDLDVILEYLEEKGRINRATRTNVTGKGKPSTVYTVAPQ